MAHIFVLGTFLSGSLMKTLSFSTVCVYYKISYMPTFCFQLTTYMSPEYSWVYFLTVSLCLSVSFCNFLVLLHLVLLIGLSIWLGPLCRYNFVNIYVFYSFLLVFYWSSLVLFLLWVTVAETDLLGMYLSCASLSLLNNLLRRSSTFLVATFRYSFQSNACLIKSVLISSSVIELLIVFLLSVCVLGAVVEITSFVQ